MNSDIDHLIFLNLSGTANKKEQGQLKEWMSESDQNRQTYHLLKKSWNIEITEPTLINEEEVFEKVWKEGVESKTHGAFISASFLKIAASLLIIFMLGYLVMFVVNKPKTQLVEVHKKTIRKENPNGQKSKLFLPDGTIVWLNAKSSIEFLESFTDSTRIVHLKGEAYFEVTKDKLRPFIVKTNNVSTEALGTVFNINSFENERDINVKLVSGKVNVTSNGKSFILNSGQAISVNRKTKSTNRYEFDNSDVAVWRNGVLIFKNASFDEVIHRLERWYGVSVHVTGPKPKDWQVSGKFDNKYLLEILSLIQYTRDFKFELNNKDLNIILTKP